MAASLVADYCDSSSESETYESNDNVIDEKHRSEIEEPCEKPTNDYFQTADDNLSDGDEGEHEDSAADVSTNSPKLEIVHRLPNPLALPLANFSSTDDCNSSVFVTAFQRAEDAKQSLLERHVKMTTVIPTEPGAQKLKRRKQDVCINFLKGRCRYGQNCRYSHEVGTPDEPSSSGTALPSHVRQYGYEEQVLDGTSDDVDDEDGFGLKEKRRKRVGITDSLVPPKRAMQSLHKQREKERPWTMKQ